MLKIIIAGLTKLQILNKFYMKSHSKAADMAQGAECLPSKCKALSSNPSTAKKTKTKQNKTKPIAQGCLDRR
jgi:hypothetical protein